MSVTYFMFARKRRFADLGVYHTYDLAVFDRFLGDGPIRVVPDVTSDGDLAYGMVQTFNRYQLSPVHLMDVVLDLLG